MDAIMKGNECEVDPTPQWVEQSLMQLSLAEKGKQFLCLLRGSDDQMNVLREPDGFVLEWYLADKGGALAAYRESEGMDHQQTRKIGFFTSLFSKQPATVGSRLKITEVARVLNAYVGGASDFPNLHWKPIYS